MYFELCPFLLDRSRTPIFARFLNKTNNEKQEEQETNRDNLCRNHPHSQNKKGRLLDEGAGGMAEALLVGGGDDAGGNGAGIPPPPMVYSIRSGDNRIGSFILHKADFCAGDIILGNFDFSAASTRCLQVRNRGRGGAVVSVYLCGGLFS